jgi:hypothetical protein
MRRAARAQQTNAAITATIRPIVPTPMEANNALAAPMATAEPLPYSMQYLHYMSVMN